MPRVPVAVLILLAGGSASALAAPPFGGAAVGAASSTALAVQCPQGGTGCFGGANGTTSAIPTALAPNTIGAAMTYQQVAPAGTAATSGGFVQPNVANTGLICLDASRNARSGLTTPTGGQICQAAIGSAAPLTFPATAGAVYVYGTSKGDSFTGSAE